MKTHLIFLSAMAVVLSSCNRLPNLMIAGPGDEPESYKDHQFTNYFKSKTGWNAGDVGISVNLNNGKSLWVYGDSFTGQLDTATNTLPCLFNVRNAAVSMGIADPAQQQTHIGTGFIKSYFQLPSDQANDRWFWPGVGYTNGDTSYIFMGRVEATGTGGGFGFTEVDSQYVAKVYIPTMQVAGFIRMGPKNGIVFINGVIREGSYNYVYGAKNNGMGRDIIVARYPFNNIYAAWEYYNGSGWSANIMTAAGIHSEFTSSFDILKLGGKYVMITTELSTQCDQGNRIFTQTSDNPFGPFINKQTVWTLDDLKGGHTPFFYIAAAHPEYDNGNDELLITYSINGYQPCLPICNSGRMDPDDYRPKAIRVPYKLIDSSL